MRSIGQATLSHRLSGLYIGLADLIPVLSMTAQEWRVSRDPDYRQRSLTDMQLVKEGKPAPLCPTGCGRPRYVTKGANPHYASYCRVCHRAVSARRYKDLKAKK